MNGPHLRLNELLDLHSEWIIVNADGDVFSLRSHEMEFGVGAGGPYFGFLDHAGYGLWRVKKIDYRGDRMILELSRKLGGESARLELIPRTSARELGAAVELSRLEMANQVAEKVGAGFRSKKLKRVFLNHETGRYVHILFHSGHSGEEGVIADVTGSLTPDMLLTSAVLWLQKSEGSRDRRIRRVFIFSEKRTVGDLRKLHACLNTAMKRKIALLAPRCSVDPDDNESGDKIFKPEPLELEDLWKPKAPKLTAAPKSRISPLVRSIVRLAPGRIDHLSAKNGITLRYLGLPFARVRRLLGKEQIWFGIGREKLLLDRSSKEELYQLVRSIGEYRKFDTPNKQHLYFQVRSEAWLESLLRRNIRRLDPNLFLSPLYNQFRTARGRIDLLALRKDGRLVIVELKVTYDRGMIFQAVNYWRKIEAQRRAGLLDGAALFGRRRIADRPAVVYLVAPTLCFQKETDVLSRCLASEIEVFRFELNENWREKVKVLKVNGRNP